MNINAETFELEVLDEIVKNIKTTHKAVTTFESSREAYGVRLTEARKNVQEALDASNLDDVTKFTSEMKRIVQKLEEKPDEKIQAFQDAVLRLERFVDDGYSATEDATDDMPIAEAA